MGTEGVWIPAVIAAVGAGASYYNTEQTAKRQDAELARQIVASSQRQREADALVNKTLMEQEGSNADQYEKDALQQYTEQLQRTKGSANRGLSQVGEVSDRFAQDTANAEKTIDDYGASTAKLYSRIDAPANQRMAEGITFSRLAGDLDTVRSGFQSADYLNRMRLGNIRRDPWLDAFTQAAESYSASGGY